MKMFKNIEWKHCFGAAIETIVILFASFSLCYSVYGITHILLDGLINMDGGYVAQIIAMSLLSWMLVTDILAVHNIHYRFDFRTGTYDELNPLPVVKSGGCCGGGCNDKSVTKKVAVKKKVVKKKATKKKTKKKK